jgi:hypothetical protein
MPYTPEQLDQILKAFSSPVAEAAPSTSIRDLQAPVESPVQAEMETSPPSVYDEYQKKYLDTQKRRAAGELYIAQQMLANPGQQEAINKALKGVLNADVPEMPPFEQTEPAKKIMERLPSFANKDYVIKNIKKELDAAARIKDSQEKMQRIFTILPKMIQSAGTGGTDALQPAEIILGLPEAQTIFTWASVNKKDLTSPTTWLEIKTDPVLKNAFTADPDAYLKKARGVYNTISSTRNDELNQFERMSSKDWVRKNTGLQLLEQYQDDDLQKITARPQATAAFSVGAGGVPIRTEMPQSVQNAAQNLKKAYRDASGKLIVPK